MITKKSVFIIFNLLWGISAHAINPFANGQSKFTNHPNINLIPKKGKCGIQNAQDYIFSGIKTNIDEFPWMALLFYEEDGYLINKCGGTLINQRYVLTAAHCVVDKPIVSVRLGEYNTLTEKDCVPIFEGVNCAYPYQDFKIEEKIWHENYNPKDDNRWDDIALLRLNESVQINDFVRPICLPINTEKTRPGEILTVAGWGFTEYGFNSPVKLKLNLPVKPLMSCKQIYSARFRINISGSKQFCAGGRTNEDSCTGDSRGPLMGLFPFSSDFYIEGIVSFGPTPCGKQAIPGIYVKVSEYIDWILDNLKPY